MRYICSDQRLLENTGMNARKCQIGVSTFAEACWKIMDKLGLNYELAGNENGKERFASISDMYNHCVQAKWVTSIIKSQPN